MRGVELFERRVGNSGPLIPVLHGGPGAHHDYLRPGMDALATGRTLIYYDQRGGGKSAVERTVPVGWTEQVADLEALRQIWGLDQLDLVGYSWGGMLAMLYAIRHPARVRSLALVSPAPASSKERASYEAALAARSRTPEIVAARAALQSSGLRETDPAAYAQRLFELAVAGYFHNPSRARELTPFRVTGRTQSEVWNSLGAEYDFRPELRALHIPALVLHGEDDPIPMASAELTAAALGAELVRLPATGHVPYVEAHEAFVTTLNAFLPRE